MSARENFILAGLYLVVVSRWVYTDINEIRGRGRYNDYRGERTIGDG